MKESDYSILFSVVIPNYNGADYLDNCIKHVMTALNDAPFGWEVIVVDDHSKDGSAKIAARTSGVRLIENTENQGFGATCNRGVKAAHGDIIYLLNNDVLVEPGFYVALSPHMQEQDVFSVTSYAYDENGNTVEGRHVPGFVAGFLKAVVDPHPPMDRPSPTIYASGGASAFNRDKFLALGGFDPLYHPFYWEDLDLGYRAWKRGWRVVFEPRSRVLHRSHGVIRNNFDNRYIGSVNRRNQLICNWKNLTDMHLRILHFTVLGLRTFAKIITLRPYMIPVIKQAYCARKSIRAARAAEAPHIRRSDAMVFAYFAKRYNSQEKSSYLRRENRD